MRKHFLRATHAAGIYHRMAGSEDQKIMMAKELAQLSPAAATALLCKSPGPGEFAAVFDAFCAALFPDGKIKNLSWACRQMLADPLPPREWETLAADIAYFEALRPRLQADKRPTALSSVGSAQHLHAILQPYAEHRRDKDVQKQKLRVADHVAEQARAETTVVYSGPEGKIVVPHTMLAARYWGNETKWCVSNRDKIISRFGYYDRRGPLVVYLPRPRQEDRDSAPAYSSFKFAAGDWQVFDEIDKKLPSRVPPCLKTLAHAALKNMDAEGAAWLSRHGLADMILDRQDTTLPPLPEQQRALLAFITADSGRTFTAPEIPPELRNDRDFMFAAVCITGSLLAVAPDALKADPVLAMAAVVSNGEALGAAAPRLRENRTLMMRAVRHHPRAAFYALLDQRNDVELMASARTHAYLGSTPLRYNPVFLFGALRAGGEISVPEEVHNLNAAFYAAVVRLDPASLDPAAPGHANDNLPAEALKAGHGLAYHLTDRVFADRDRAEDEAANNLPAPLALARARQMDAHDETVRRRFLANKGYLTAAITAAIKAGNSAEIAQDLRRSPLLWGDFKTLISPEAALKRLGGG